MNVRTPPSTAIAHSTPDRIVVKGADLVEELIAERHRAERRPLHGFGHPHHKPDDPRTPRLFAVAEREGVAGRHIGALRTLAGEVDRVYGRHITINATGAIAAVLGEIGIPQSVMRGIAVISRSAGLVGHILEERERPAARFIWETVESSIPYDRPDGAGGN